MGGITFYPGWGEDRVSVMDDPAIARMTVHGSGRRGAAARSRCARR